jgi:hypothetical protein
MGVITILVVCAICHFPFALKKKHTHDAHKNKNKLQLKMKNTKHTRERVAGGSWQLARAPWHGRFEIGDAGSSEMRRCALYLLSITSIFIFTLHFDNNMAVAYSILHVRASKPVPVMSTNNGWLLVGW